MNYTYMSIIVGSKCNYANKHYIYPKKKPKVNVTTGGKRGEEQVWEEGATWITPHVVCFVP